MDLSPGHQGPDGDYGGQWRVRDGQHCVLATQKVSPAVPAPVFGELSADFKLFQGKSGTLESS